MYFVDQSMTVADEELLISPGPPLPPSQQRSSPSRLPAPQPIRIECRAEERHFTHSIPLKIHGASRPIRLTTSDSAVPGQYRSEIIVHSNPATDFYIKKLRVAYHAHDDQSFNPSRAPRSSSRSHSVHAPSQQKPRRPQSGKSRSVSFPRSNSQAILHQWIDDLCADANLLANDDISFFLKNGEFLARI